MFKLMDGNRSRRLPRNETTVSDTRLDPLESYIVYLGTHPVQLNASLVDHDHAVLYHYELLGSCLGSIKKAKSSLFYSYNRFINGFACVLHDDDVPKVQKHPKVISVFLNHGRKLQTTHSWNFLGLEKDYDNIPSNSIWKKTNFGDDVIIGNIDSGVWPESKSFADEGIGPVPERWQGTCNSKDEVKCNRKLIGVRYFNKGYLKYARRVARRHNSTYTVTPKMMTSPKGGSPRARVASYKVCWEPIDNRQCFDADIMAAIEAAISDGVDVLSISIGGGPEEYFNDGVAIGSFHAVKQGISVVVSGGNQGPMPGSVGNIAPWLFTIGASTTDREFVNYVTLGNNKIFKGVSLSDKGLKSEKFYPMITGEDARANDTPVKNASACQPGTLDPEKVKGKILVCLWLGSKQLETGKYADKLEAVGMILANHKQLPNVAFTNMHVLPTSHINSKDAPAIAGFSARGPNMIDPTILKPDVIAPGVNIIAANSEATSPTNLNSDNRRIPYITMSGTSMACPHVSGIVGLIKAVHRDWSPSSYQIRNHDNLKTDANSNPIVYENDNSAANPFAYGAGLPNPNSALDPGLVYDLNAESYLNYLCAHGYNQSLIRAFTISEKPYSCPESFNVMDLNYPSIVLPYLNGSVELTRSLKNVGSPGTYNVTVNAPSGVSIVVEPSSLNFEKYGQEKKFVIRFSPRGSEKGYRFGEMIWSDGMHNVRSPILVKNDPKKVNGTIVVCLDEMLTDRDDKANEALIEQALAGHVRPNSAMDPGLVYDLTPEDYMNYLYKFSIRSFNCPSTMSTVTRKLKNVGSPGRNTVDFIMQNNKVPASMEIEAVQPESISESGSLPPKPKFKPLKAHEMSDVYEGMKLDIRMNLKARKVELKTRPDTPDISNLQKCADFVHAFMLGFDVIDAIALLRLDELYVESFEIKDVKTLRGEHLSRAIGRLSGKGGKTKFAIENATKTRIVIADTKIHILGSFASIKIARDSLCSLILGSPAGKVYSKLRSVTARLAERF
ncbi:hypothetical protein Patl1_03730 [Pistacia atlantica]|uniref:Uncharacterized protein n=1 Tax=Pistacia atlantica TaxID=434234 RepID=A0ACC1BRL5_9ROSI|nr:hypothetical protein Patl1_03730 [Pistacia atlantica]